MLGMTDEHRGLFDERQMMNRSLAAHLIQAKRGSRNKPRIGICPR